MTIEAPTWATSNEIIAHGRLLLALFDNRAHFDSFLQTGSMARPRQLKHRARIAADPIKSQREHLRRAVENAKTGIRRAQEKISVATEGLANGALHWKFDSLTLQDHRD